MSNVRGRHIPSNKWIKKDMRQVHSQFRALLCLCKMHTEPVKRWDKYSPTDRPSGWGTPFTSRVPSLTPFLRKKNDDVWYIHYPQPLPLFICFSVSQQVAPQFVPHKIHLNPGCENSKSLWFGQGVMDICETGWRPLQDSDWHCADVRRLMCGSSNLLRKERRTRTIWASENHSKGWRREGEFCPLSQSLNRTWRFFLFG